MTPYDLVPSNFQFLLLPMCEGIALGLLFGSGISLVIDLVERFFVAADRRPAQPAVIGPSPPHSPRVAAPPRLARRLPLAKAC